MAPTDTAPLRPSNRRVSFGQTGQDVLAEFLMIRNKIITREEGLRGTYVDIGCNHPHSGSNTFFFYERGWSGVCVDADPDLCAVFKAARPRDQVFSCGIGMPERVMDFFLFDNPQHNTFNPGRAKAKPERLRAVVPIRIRPLEDILTEAGTTSISFMSIDVEGLEMEVLASLNLRRFRPRLLLTEALRPIGAIRSDPIFELLTGSGYELLAHTGHDSFYLDRT